MGVEFLGVELDAEGHFFYAVAIGEEQLSFYPPLDALGFEHAIEVEQTILPLLGTAWESLRDAEPFAPFRRFFERYRSREGELEAAADLGDDEARLLEIVKSSVVEQTPADEIERRAFLRWYQHVVCENEAYRDKVRRSLEEMATRGASLAAPDEEDLG